ncbi:MAG: type II secretion system F family protein, partial [Planctomycetota bacterium]
LDRWLYVSGFRSPNAVNTFLLFQGAALVVGCILAFLISRSEPLRIGVEWLQEIPGGVGDILAPVLALAPWGILLILGLLPVTIVRSRRRAIVDSVERDFPMTLSLLATLVESGLGFDAALVRVMQSLSPERPLAVELGQFRSEAQGGLSRSVCFRRLANRLDTTSTSTFVSAMIHAENVGGGVAESLRHQADEVWNRRRQFALQRAQTLPTKLAIPLVICFLPGVFVYTFGPALAQFFEIAEGVILNGR